ncbi:Uncharacterised protein [Porphyromonas endodontalis]|nr:Uncharacterised protein [Porphyromonas endodontalis]
MGLLVTLVCVNLGGLLRGLAILSYLCPFAKRVDALCAPLPQLLALYPFCLVKTILHAVRQC